MPTYDYECPVCKHKFELFSSIHDTAPKACPSCGKKRAKRLIGAGAGFIFKGSGFYVTDSKKSSGGETASASKASDARPSGSASGDAKKAAAPPSSGEKSKKSD